jgi:hydrogenase nickel incorporation protein HypA/HybF
MHELAITQQVVDAVAEHAAGAQVRAVHVDVGKLSGVVPDAMRFCFELVTSGTCLEGAELQINEPGGRGMCRTCGTAVTFADLILLCECGSGEIDVVSGRELSVRSYEVV